MGNERTNERTKRLARGFSWELRPAPTKIVGARNSEQQDIKVQNSIKSTLYVGDEISDTSAMTLSRISYSSGFQSMNAKKAETCLQLSQ